MNSYIDAAAYGVSDANTGMVNNAAMAAALAAAALAGVKEIHLPAGRLKFSLHSLGGAGAIALTMSAVIRGAGRGNTVLKGDGFVEGNYSIGPPAVVNNPNDNDAMLFRVYAGQNDVILSDMTLEGPDVNEITGDLSVCWGIWCGGGGTLGLERIDSRLWNQTIKCSPEYPTYPGTGTKFTAIDCLIGYRSSSGILHIQGIDPDHDSCDFVRCVFEYDDGGIPTVAMQPISNGEYPCTYIGRGVSFSATDCHFKKSGRGTGATASSFGWLHYGGSGTPRYARAINCLFDSGLEHGMFTGSTASTQIIGCTFRTRAGFSAIEPEGDIVAVACSFVGDNGAAYGIVDENGGVDVAVTTVGCQFGVAGQGDGYDYSIRRISDGLKEWNIIGCTFDDIHPGGAAIGIAADAKITVQNSIFQLGSGVYSISVTKGTAVVNDCRFKTSRAVYVDGSVGNSVLELNRNRWDASAPTEINSPGVFTINLNGTDNQFFENSRDIGEGCAIVSHAALNQLSGDMQVRRGVGGYTFDHGTGTLTGSWNHDSLMFDEPHVPTVQNFYLPGGGASGVRPTDHLRFCMATMKILSRHPFNLGITGNIIPKRGPHPVARNEVVTLQHFPALMKWVEL